MICMEKLASTINMSFRVDKKLKKQADELCRKLGMNTSVALNMVWSQSVRDGRIPFIPSLNRVPNEDLRQALKEGNDILDEKIEAKSFNNVDDFIEDVIKWFYLQAKQNIV